MYINLFVYLCMFWASNQNNTSLSFFGNLWNIFGEVVKSDTCEILRRRLAALVRTIAVWGFCSNFQHKKNTFVLKNGGAMCVAVRHNPWISFAMGVRKKDIKSDV